MRTRDMVRMANQITSFSRLHEDALKRSGNAFNFWDRACASSS
jgi:hypothetical protein